MKTFLTTCSSRATATTRMFDGGIPEKMIMERSGHFCIAGVWLYERTTSLQQKELSDLLSSKTKCAEEWKILKELSLNTSTSGSCSQHKEEKSTAKTDTTQIPEMMKQFNFSTVHGCTLNFNFTSKWCSDNTTLVCHGRYITFIRSTVMFFMIMFHQSCWWMVYHFHLPFEIMMWCNTDLVPFVPLLWTCSILYM